MQTEQNEQRTEDVDEFAIIVFYGHVSLKADSGYRMVDRRKNHSRPHFALMCTDIIDLEAGVT